VAGSVVLQVVVVYVLFLQNAFGTTPLSGPDWLICLAVASSVLWLREASKAMRRVARSAAH
jgi:Ca2+-transporting ATPase